MASDPYAHWRTQHYDPNPVEREGAHFDELVVGEWFHLEAMAPGHWWIRIGDARVFVTLTPGQPPRVDVERGCYAPTNGETTRYQLPPTQR